MVNKKKTKQKQQKKNKQEHLLKFLYAIFFHKKHWDWLFDNAHISNPSKKLKLYLVDFVWRPDGIHNIALVAHEGSKGILTNSKNVTRLGVNGHNTRDEQLWKACWEHMVWLEGD